MNFGCLHCHMSSIYGFVISDINKTIMNSSLFLRFANRKCLNLFSNSQTILFRSTQCLDPPDDLFTIPRPHSRENEPVEQRRARLVYQSRKRGMLENDLLLSTFVAKYLNSFDERQLEKYDSLINGPSNDWEIYYWATNLKETPIEYNHDVMDLLKLHCKNLNKESRIRQPDL